MTPQPPSFYRIRVRQPSPLMSVALLPLVPLAQAQPAGGGLGSMLIPLLLIGLITYFMIIRPQARREKTRRTMIEALKKGDKVVTIGGIHGTIVKVEDAAVLLQVDDNTKLRFDKNAVASVAARDEKGAPAKPAPAKEAPAKEASAKGVA